MTAVPAAAAQKRKTRARPLAHEVAEAAHRQLKTTAVLAAFSAAMHQLVRPCQQHGARGASLADNRRILRFFGLQLRLTSTFTATNTLVAKPFLRPTFI